MPLSGPSGIIPGLAEPKLSKVPASIYAILVSGSPGASVYQYLVLKSILSPFFTAITFAGPIILPVFDDSSDTH
jgi:hypothetical protein